ncbi:PolC-type DNA polymerase III [Tepidibacillus sp. HK-1]|uniref:3'-5' exonuclease n=1 Tax=Tepidibacillus sp. HK-1 TaxID=1883407 RepID=UPI000852B38E|nr:exonuclease domain-containing protein [Tepidibacillus sp. HK-1]GBF10697.1 DNA polymerase III PolC-type [Tepidibacillus sp. HK-1]
MGFLQRRRKTSEMFDTKVYDKALIAEIRRLTSSTKHIIDLDDELKTIEFVVFDTETTGFFPYAGDKIISIGAVKLKEGEIKESFHCLVNPEREVPKEIEELTGIYNHELQDKPKILEAALDFLRFAENTYLVAHCADFDLHFLDVALKRGANTRLLHPIIDTMMLSYHLHPDWTSHHFDVILEKYQIPIIDRHSALGDAKMTALLFQFFLEQLEERGIKTIGALKRSIPSVCRQAPYIRF